LCNRLRVNVAIKKHKKVEGMRREGAKCQETAGLELRFSDGVGRMQKNGGRS
jgi:hypothetical protein